MARIATALGLLLVLGCSQGVRIAHLPSSSKRLAGIGLDEAFSVVKKVLRGEYRIDQIDRDNYVLHTAPVEYVTSEPTGRLADQVLGGKNLHRRVAIVRVSPSATGATVVYVRVEVQRYDTRVRRAFAYQRQSSDLPSEVSAAETSSGGPERRDAWTMVRRDRAEEQQIIQAIQAMLGPGEK